MFMALASGSPAGVSSLRLDSEAGDSVGQGQAYFFTPFQARFSATATGTNHVWFTVETVPSEHYFGLTFSASEGEALTVGSYTGAARFPGRGFPGLDVYGDGNGCNTTEGRFEVKQAVYDAGNTLIAFWATFEQHCEGTQPALFGEIRFNADIPVVVTAPAAIVASEGQPIAFKITALGESKNGLLTLGATNLPPGASLVDNGDNTATFSWTPAVGQAGGYRVTFVARNSSGDTDTAPTRIRIPPPNDAISEAILMATFPFTNFVNTTAATRDLADPVACGYPDGTVWYRLNSNHRARIEANTFLSDFPNVLTVWTGSPGALQYVGCGNDSNGWSSRVEFTAEPNQNYYLMIGSYQREGGVLKLIVNEILPPPNDDFDRALAIHAFPFVDPINLSLATSATDDPAACGFPVATVWYSFIPDQDVYLVPSVSAGSGSGVGVFTGSRGALATVNCFGYGGGFIALAGQTYYMMAGGASQNPEGTGTFTVLSYPVLRCDLAIDPTGRFDSKTGVATISGKVSSSQTATFGLRGTLRQKAGRFHLFTGEIGSQYSPVVISCEQQAPWRVEVTGDGPFGGGAATVSLTWSVYDPVSGQYIQSQASEAVHLRGSNR
jgi:Putative Ig domain